MRPTLRKVLLSMTVVGIAGALAGTTTFAALDSTTDSSGNDFEAGTVKISDNDAGNSMLSLPNADAGASKTACITVTYTGTLPATVRMYGTVQGTIGQYLTLTVTRGTIAAPSFPSCSAFVADSTDHIGAGPGIIYQGPLSSFPASYSAGVVDPSTSSPSTWSNSTVRSYRFGLVLSSDPAAQAKQGTASVTWEAQNT